jgi:homopolymeric O-antigen transport system ATP-binding protein
MVEKDSVYVTTLRGQSQKQDRAAVRAPEVVETIPNIDHRFGDKRAEVIGIAVLDANGHPTYLLEPSSRVIVRISVRAHEDIALPIVGFLMRNHLGLDFAGTNTARENFELPAMAAGDIFTVDFHLQLPELHPVTFSFSPAIADGTLQAYKTCDWIDNAIVLQMGAGEGEVYGAIHLPCRVELNRCLDSSETALSHAEPNFG